MLNIIIDGKRTVLKDNLSFEYVAENRSFTKSDDYTLEITFPLKDCVNNMEIFGMLFRKELAPVKLIYDCEIIDNAFHKIGSIIITEYSESEVKCQFLEGRSGKNLTSPIADVYINEIEIASPQTNKSLITPYVAWQGVYGCVALPWVNNDSGNIQNKITYNKYGIYEWNSETEGLSWMPYMTTIIKKICEAISYSCDISEIDSDDKLKYLLVCNALPFAWGVPEVARALPHWTVEQFFDKLEDLLFGEFEIDHVNKSIRYFSPENLNDGIETVFIDKDINEFTAEAFASDSDCKAKDVSNIKYKSANHRMQKFYDCTNAISNFRSSKRIISFNSMDQLIHQIKYGYFWAFNESNRGLSKNLINIYYIVDEDRYLCTVCLDGSTNPKKWSLQNLNDFGEYFVNDSENAKIIELEMIPACIDYTDQENGFSLFNEIGSNSDDVESKEDITAEEQIMNNDFKRSSAEYYDKIYLGFWDGNIQFEGKNPFPNVTDLLAMDHNDVKRVDFTMSINVNSAPARKYAKKIDTSVRYNISFLTDTLPSPRSVFLIKGKKYVCEKLTAAMTVKGMSSKVKGIFWRLND